MADPGWSYYAWDRSNHGPVRADWAGRTTQIARFGSLSRDCIRLRRAYITLSSHSCKQKRPLRTVFNRFISLRKSGAGEGIRTLDPNLGKVVLYP